MVGVSVASETIVALMHFTNVGVHKVSAMHENKPHHSQPTLHRS